MTLLQMDLAWHDVFSQNAVKRIPDHQKSCWSKKGFEERFNLTKELIDSLLVNSIVDVGCGPGAYCDHFHKRGYEVTGVDYSASVIDLAQKNYPELDLLVASGYNLPFRNKSFDLVLSLGVLQCLVEHEKFIGELARTAKKHILLSTLRRAAKVDNPIQLLKKQLKNDPWPTRTYHPSEIIPVLEREGFSTQLITHHNGRLLNDAFFILATR